MLHKVKFDKSSQKLNRDEELYWMHFLKSDPLVGDFIKSQLAHDPEYKKKVLKQNVCPKCEKFMFFHTKDTSICPKCGGVVPNQKTHSVKIHLKEGHFR